MDIIKAIAEMSPYGKARVMASQALRLDGTLIYPENMRDMIAESTGDEESAEAVIRVLAKIGLSVKDEEGGFDVKAENVSFEVDFAQTDSFDADTDAVITELGKLGNAELRNMISTISDTPGFVIIAPKEHDINLTDEFATASRIMRSAFPNGTDIAFRYVFQTAGRDEPFGIRVRAVVRPEPDVSDEVTV